MHYWPLIVIVALLTGGLSATPLSQLKLSELEQRLKEIDTELTQLATMSLRSGVGSIGYRSRSHQTSEQNEWVEIKFDQEYTLDEIVLIPALWRDSEKGFQPDGLPNKFRIIVGNSNDTEGTLLGEFDSTADPSNSIAPYIISGHGVQASWIRIEATQLSQRAFDNRSIFQLSEVFIFSGEKNIALRQPVKVSSEHQETNNSAWNPRFLVDGHTPYLMNAAQGPQSLAYISMPGHVPVLTIDLATEVPLSRIHLHTLEQSDTVPQAFAGDLGIPHHLKIEGAKLPDFSDAVILLENQTESINDTGPIMMWNIPETSCRYIRLSEVNPSDSFRIGFAEIELFSNDQNIAQGKLASITGRIYPQRSPDTLTDGRNLYGEILPVRAWLNQLARRHALEIERPKVEHELALRYTRQKNNLRWISWLAAILLLGTVAVMWYGNISRQRAVARTRERIAANLHDELGANLHAIGLLGDFAKKIVTRKNTNNEWEELNEVIDEVRSLTEETGATARYCTNMLETKEIHANLVAEMKQATSRLLADLEYEISFPEEDSLHQLKPRRRIDLYLFYKECLTNIIRHSSSTHVTAELTATGNDIQLIVRDNGLGLTGTHAQVPESLRRCAKMLGGNVVTKNLDSGGTQITLQLRPRRRLLFSQN